jgi:vanillate O-demethylase monooxygenase subunit
MVASVTNQITGWIADNGADAVFGLMALDACAGYLVIARNYDRDRPVKVLRDFEDTIFEQDRRIVESQRPEKVPFDLAEEMHLKFDAVAVAYRRAMRQQGLANVAPR